MKIIKPNTQTATTFKDVKVGQVFTTEYQCILYRTDRSNFPFNLETGGRPEMNADEPVTIYPNAVLILEPDAPADADDENMRELIALRARVEKLREWATWLRNTPINSQVARDALQIMEGKDES